MLHAWEVAAEIRAGTLSPVEHVRDALARLRTDRHNAVITLAEESALAQARLLADELATGGWRGPLHGMAVGIKDLIDVAGLPTRCGSNVLADAPPAAADAEIVSRLRRAGAVIVAKLHTHEFAYGPTGDVAATGPARNPHDPSRITGGSSSGSAAMVATGALPLALGTDTGGSVRIPAALCGVVGLKPEFGALPTAGVFPLSGSLDHVGLLAADPRSVALAWEVLHPRPDVIRPRAIGETRIGMPVDSYWRAVDPVITAGVRAVAATFVAAGARVVEVDTPDIGELVGAYPLICGAEAYSTHARWLAERPGDYQEATSRRLLPFADQPAATYAEAVRTRRRLTAVLRAHLRGIDALLLPSTPLRATPIGASEVADQRRRAVAVRPALLSLTLPFNMTGWPAVSIPGPVADGGLPVGVQLVGVRLAERDLLRIAMSLEAGVAGPRA